MSIRSRLADAIGGRSRRVVHQEKSNRLHINPLCSAYENLFAQVRPVINGMKKVVPYGVTDRGTVLPMARTPELKALMVPNDDMSFLDFLDTALIAWLTLSELNIHVQKTPCGRVIGYSILPAGCRIPASVWDGETDKFEFMNEHDELVTLYPDEVMTLRFSRSPLNTDQGVSPANAVFIWSQIDDLMAQYQKAYLENGAVPAHLTFIRASTRDLYEKKRADLESGLAGASNKNKTLYIWRQQLDDGTTGDEIEVKTIQGNNAQLAIKELISVVDDRLNKAFGVSNFILGNDSSAKYDNAELTKLRFAEDVVYPALVDFWNKFQHELDRVTGGLGYAITFDMEIPELTDRAKVRAETRKIQTDALLALIGSGASPTGAVKALDLGEEWLTVATDMVNASTAALTAPQSDLPALDKAPEVHIHTCTHDHAPETTTDSTYQPVFEAGEELEKKIYDALMELAEEIAAENPELSVDEVKQRIIEALTESANSGAETGAQHIQALLAGGDPDKAEILKALEDNGFQVSEGFVERMKERTDKLVEGFEEHTREIVQQTLTTATEEGLSASQLKTQLAQALPRSRAVLIARNEVGHAFQAARLETDEAIAKKYGFRVKITWNAELDERTCDVCEAMNGTSTYLGTAFADTATTKDGEVVGWEHTEWNDYGREPNAHANCRCTFDEEFE